MERWSEGYRAAGRWLAAFGLTSGAGWALVIYTSKDAKLNGWPPLVFFGVCVLIGCFVFLIPGLPGNFWPGKQQAIKRDMDASMIKGLEGAAGSQGLLFLKAIADAVDRLVKAVERRGGGGLSL